jgi:drug/metabolite transporter (DMT)-like permease
VLASVLWSSSGLFIKLIDWHPMAIAGMRSAVAALFLVLAMRRRMHFHLSRSQLAGALAYALTVILFVLAVRMTTAANAILLQYTAPVYTAILGAWFLKEKVFRLDWGIIVMVIGGMSLFFLDELAPGALLGNILSVISGMTFSVFMLCMRKQKTGSPLETVILGNTITALVCIPFYFQGTPGVDGWAALGFLGIFQLGLPFIFYSTAIKHLTVLDAILIQVVEPLLNPIWVLLVIGEAPGPWAVAGGLVVLASVTGRGIYQNRLAGRRIRTEQKDRQSEKIAGCAE